MMFVTDREAPVAVTPCHREIFSGAGVALTAVKVAKLAFSTGCAGFDFANKFFVPLDAFF